MAPWLIYGLPVLIFFWFMSILWNLFEHVLWVIHPLRCKHSKNNPDIAVIRIMRFCNYLLDGSLSWRLQLQWIHWVHIEYRSMQTITSLTVRRESGYLYIMCTGGLHLHSRNCHNEAFRYFTYKHPCQNIYQKRNYRPPVANEILRCDYSVFGRHVSGVVNQWIFIPRNDDAVHAWMHLDYSRRDIHRP